MWGATGDSDFLSAVSGFQSTRPVWGATIDIVRSPKIRRYFNPRAPCGARPTKAFALLVTFAISIHAPRVGRDSVPVRSAPAVQYFNPRAPCGARLAADTNANFLFRISIHAPRVGRDLTAIVRNACGCISIHAPRVGRDNNLLWQTWKWTSFQSTRPVWGATGSLLKHTVNLKNFNPRAPCGARLRCPAQCFPHKEISIHAPRVGRDDAASRCRQSCVRISIHAPRVGRDREPAPVSRRRYRISIHAPRVGRDPANFGSFSSTCKFQSTRPVWGATFSSTCKKLSTLISIHAPRVGRDPLRSDVPAPAYPYFNPRAPCGARPKEKPTKRR